MAEEGTRKIGQSRGALITHAPCKVIFRLEKGKRGEKRPTRLRKSRCRAPEKGAIA